MLIWRANIPGLMRRLRLDAMLVLSSYHLTKLDGLITVLYMFL